MGDMKTPDFDDLLAAFDIPDIDTNEAIHSGHEEADAHIKQVPGEPGPPDHVLPHTDITAVSVIVKNTVCPEQLDALDGRSKDGHVIGPRLLQNGFGAAEMPRSPTSRSVEAVASSNGECWVKEKGPKPLDIFSHFSPDPNEDSAANLIDRPRDPRECKPKEKSLAVPSLSPSPTPSLDCKEPMGESAENLPPAFPQSFETSQAGGANGSPPTIACIKKEESDSEEVGREASPKGLAAALGDSPLDHLKSVTVRYSTDDSPITSWPGSDPNLDSGTSSLPEVKHSPASPREPFFKPSSPVVQSPRLPASPKHLDSISLKEEQEVLEKSMGSPQSMSSAEEEEEEDDNNNDSPSSNSSRPLKVRIKTIKTSCGSITRTVTRVSSDSEPGSAKGPAEQSSQDTSLEGAGFSADKEEGIALEVAKEKMELSSPLKTIEGPKIVSVQLGNGTKLKGTVLPVSTIQNASSAMLIAASVAQQKSVVLPAKTGKAVAKNIINLVPQTLPKADTRTNVSTVTQTATITTTANQKVNGTTVVMVQPQKPSPTIPARRAESLPLPPFGSRCLECGDSFALEKSLARHYDRRSMRIEVTCNHCTKRLVFFNKCSLLLHAREHKDKGLVMQCSHLVMRPIALDQMIGQPDITPLVSVTSFPASKVTGVAQDALAAASGAQDLPILPLSSSSEQTNYSCFRCLECKEQCKDKAGLAAHFQQAVATGTTSSTSVKKFPCHLCERSFCSAPSLRRHVRVNHEGIKRVYPCRYCTEGKRTFSSRLILEKHIQVRHGIKVTDQTKSQEVVIARIGTGATQVRGLCGLSRCPQRAGALPRFWAGPKAAP
nr:PREDICTED: zinc finger protein 687 [Opisthocomus hoazin]